MSANLMIWVNGERVTTGAAAIQPIDRGLLRGDGIFETMRAHGGRIFRFDRHLARLQRGADALRMPIPATLQQQVLSAVAEANRSGIANAGVRLTLTRGPDAGFSIAVPQGVQPTVIVIVSPFPDFGSTHSKGIAMHIASGRRNEHAMTRGCKIISYADGIMGMADAKAAGCDDVLFLDTAGHVSEGATANVFIISDDELVTPPLSCGALPGVTRGSVLELAAAAGIPTVERVVELDELKLAREAFVSSSLRAVAPLVRIDQKAICDGVPGPLTQKIMADYQTLVKKETG